MIAKPAFRNGHHITKAEGDTMWTGRLAQLPPPRQVTEEQAAEAMHEEGFVQIPDLLSPQEVAELRSWMDNAGGPDERYVVKGWCFNRHVAAQPHRDPKWLELMDREPAYGCLRLILGEGFGMGGGSMWTTGDGRRMGLHTDVQWVSSLPEDILADPRVRLPIFSCTLQYYLDDQVEEIGPTVVVPGSWRAGRHPVGERDWNGRQPQIVSVRAGGGVLFRSDLWHGAELNRSGRRRYVIQVHYSHRSRTLGYPSLRFQEYYSAEVLAKATKRQRGMMGEAAEKTGY